MSDQIAWTDYVQVAAGVAQVVTAGVALTFAYRANRISRASHLQQRLSAELATVATMARDAHDAFDALMGEFPTAPARREARKQWMKTHELVQKRLFDLGLLEPKIKDIDSLWDQVYAMDRCTNEVVGKVEYSERKAAEGAYAKVYEKFMSALSEVARALADG